MSTAPLAAPALASNSSGGVTSDTTSTSSSTGSSAPLAPYVAPVLPTAAPQPLSISVTSVGGYQVGFWGSSLREFHLGFIVLLGVWGAGAALVPLTCHVALLSLPHCLPLSVPVCVPTNNQPQINRQGSVWSARTSTSPEQLFLRQSSRGRLTFTVDYRKVSLTSGAYVMGSITLTNPNAQVRGNTPVGLGVLLCERVVGWGRAWMHKCVDACSTAWEAAAVQTGAAVYCGVFAWLEEHGGRYPTPDTSAQQTHQTPR